MKVFILQRVVWDHVDSEIRTILKVYTDAIKAMDERNHLQDSEGRVSEFRGIDFEVEEFDVE